MKRILHPLGGAVALLMIAGFWLSTLVTELSRDTAAIIAVKTAIPYGFLLLIPALALAGGTGLSLSRGGRKGFVEAKRKRMPIIAANGVLVLVPAALFLAARAEAGVFDTAFYAVQAVELAAGAANLLLLSRNMRDGLRMTGRLRRPAH